VDRIESDPTPAGEPIDPTPVGEPIDPAPPQHDEAADQHLLPPQPEADEESGPPIPPPPSRRQINPVLELGLILLAALGLWWVANGWIVKPYRIPSASMEPTLRDGDRVLVARFIYHFHDPRRGDVIVFHPPGNGDSAILGAKTEASVYFIKRIIGLPGETVEGRRHHVLICTAPSVGCHVLNEPYLTQAAVAAPFGPVTVPQGQYFMMGDNRAVSDDSRMWGTLPRSYIIGEAFATYWPPDRLRTL
jgi:signal peptidase I